MEHLKNKLEARGWTEREIKRTEEMLHNAELKKSPIIKIADKMLFWLFFLVVTVGNFLLVMALIPILLSFSKGIVYILLSLIAVFFGIIFNILMNSFEFSKKKQYVSLTGTAIFSIIFILFVNSFASNLSGFVYRNRDPIFLILAYLLAFITPYFIIRTFVYYRNRTVA